MKNRPWLGWVLLGLSAASFLIAITEWSDDRGTAIGWVLVSVLGAIRGIPILRSSETDDL